MQLDIGSEPYLSTAQVLHSYLLATFSMAKSDLFLKIPKSGTIETRILTENDMLIWQIFLRV